MAATAITATSTTVAEVNITPNTLLIEAPEDVQVVSVTGGHTKKGQQLVILKSFHIEMMEIQLDLFKQHVAIMERPFNDGRIDAEIALLIQKL